MEDQKISIKTAAESLGTFLIIAAYADTEAIKKEIKKHKPNIEEEVFEHILIEIIYFYVNITDRFAFAYLGDPKRHKFFDLFLIEVYKNYLKGYKSAGGKTNEETFYEIFNETYKKRQKEYGAFKYPIENGFGTKEDLVYQFAHIPAEILGAKDSEFVIGKIWIVVMVSIKKYHELFEKFMSEISNEKL